MASPNTPLLQLEKPDINETLVDSNTYFQQNWDKLDKAGIVVCTSVSRPLTGMGPGYPTIYETDTAKTYVYDGFEWQSLARGGFGNDCIARYRRSIDSAAVSVESVIMPQQVVILTEERWLEFRAQSLLEVTGNSKVAQLTLRWTPGNVLPVNTDSRLQLANVTAGDTGGQVSVSMLATDIFPPGTYSFALFIRAVSATDVKVIGSSSAPTLLNIYDAGAS